MTIIGDDLGDPGNDQRIDRRLERVEHHRVRAVTAVMVAVSRSMWFREGRSHEGMVFGECSGQRLDRGGDLDPEPTFGQVGQNGRVTFAGDQRRQNRAAGHPGDLGGHR